MAPKMTRSDVYQVLSASLASPTVDLVQDLLSGELLAAVQRIAEQMEFFNDVEAHLGELEKWLVGRPLQAAGTWLKTQLDTDHVQLFVSNPSGLPAPPYAGYYFDHTIAGPTMQRISRAYELGGASLRAGFGDLPDHIAIMCEFLLYLSRNSQVRDRGTDASILDYLELDFLHQLVLPWIPEFSRRVTEAAQTPFYKATANWMQFALAKAQDEIKREQAYALRQERG